MWSTSGQIEAKKDVIVTNLDELGVVKQFVNKVQQND